MKQRLVSWGMFLLVVSAVAVLAGPSTLGGPASYVIVDGGSMEPTYEHGDLVIAYERDTYEVGDTIVYDAPVDSQFNVIHRIVDTTDGGFLTQGDNRDEVDGWIAPQDEIHGAALFHIPRGGKAVLFLRQPTTIFAIGAGWITLILMKRREDNDSDDDSERADRAASGDVPSTLEDADGSLIPSSSPIVTRRSRSATMRAKRARARSRTLALVSSAVVVGGTAGVLVAHAATLHVNAGVLQVFSEQVDIDVPESESHLVTVQAHFFDSSNKPDEAGKEIGASPYTFEPVQISAEQTYTIAWNGSGNPGNSSVVDCESEGLAFHDGLPDHDYSGEYTDNDPVSPTGDVTHLLCIQTAPGNVPKNIDFDLSNGDGYHVTLTPVEDEEESCEDDADCPEDTAADGESDGDESDGDESDGDESADDTPDDLQDQDGTLDEDDADEDTDPSRDRQDGDQPDPDAGSDNEGSGDDDEQDESDDGPVDDQIDESADWDNLGDVVDASDEAT